MPRQYSDVRRSSLIVVKDKTELNTETYDRIIENEFKNTMDSPLSTFSIDVDTASYANMRRYVSNGSLPPKDSVSVD